MTANRDAPYVAGLFALTVATGVVDAVSYLALDRVFTGNMTGNVLFVGFGFAGSGSVPLLNNVVALAGFLAGAAAAGWTVRGISRETRLPIAHLLLLGGTAGAVLMIGLVWLLLGSLDQGWMLGLTAVLAAAMGTQAAASRGAQISDVTTVVITSTLVNFALNSSLAGGNDDRWIRRAGAVLSMGAGGALGAFVVTAGSGARALLLGGACMTIGVGLLSWARYRDARSARTCGAPKTSSASTST